MTASESSAEWLSGTGSLSLFRPFAPSVTKNKMQFDVGNQLLDNEDEDDILLLFLNRYLKATKKTGSNGETVYEITRHDGSTYTINASEAQRLWSLYKEQEKAYALTGTRMDDGNTFIQLVLPRVLWTREILEQKRRVRKTPDTLPKGHDGEEGQQKPTGFVKPPTVKVQRVIEPSTGQTFTDEPHPSSYCSPEPLSLKNPASSSADLVKLLIETGLPASVGETPYASQQWLRDISEMIDAIVQVESGRTETLEFLKKVFTEVKKDDKPSPYYPERSSTSTFGEFPIFVPVDPKKFMIDKFLQGSTNVRRFHDLKTFVRSNVKGFNSDLLNSDTPMSYLESLDAQQISTELRRIKEVVRQVQLTDGAEYPQWSFLLESYLDGTRSTPETNDSEMSALTIVATLIDAFNKNHEEQQIFENTTLFSELVAYALVHIYQNQISDKGLHAGVGSLNIIGNFLNGTSSLAVNSRLLKALKVLEKVSGHLSSELIKAIINQSRLKTSTLPEATKFNEFVSGQITFETMIKKLAGQLNVAIKDSLLYPEGPFEPRDFIRNKEMESAKLTLIPKDITLLLARRFSESDSDKFREGALFDPYGLALAILAGAVDKSEYPNAYKLFYKHINVFNGAQFIPMKNAHSEKLLENRGNTLWLHRLGMVGRALVEMYNNSGTPQEPWLVLAREIYEFMTKLGFNEYYLYSEEWVLDLDDGLHKPDLANKEGYWIAQGSENKSWTFVMHFLLGQALDPELHLE
ncbi:hypothetical protein GZ77_00280 [Endozoicomonas montiporae]|uniref:Uncharacterized protein n=2 Tax=Endozoicomonas montiporae TaxID=1027273 RepID=A0A081N9Q2_9GAMM|nr:hypothetical protein GZ77_00280 [Endozoicomonas montiporae]